MAQNSTHVTKTCKAIHKQLTLRLLPCTGCSLVARYIHYWQCGYLHFREASYLKVVYDGAYSKPFEMLWHIVTDVSKGGGASTFTGIRGRSTQLPELGKIVLPTSSGSSSLLGYLNSYQSSILLPRFRKKVMPPLSRA